MDPTGPLQDLFGNGAVAPTMTLIAIAHCASTHAAGYESSYEIAVHVGISTEAAQRISDVIRSIQAEEANEEPEDFKLLDGTIIEADETSARVERNQRPKDWKLLSCKSNELGRCVGYRLPHRRFMCICSRDERHLAMFFELPEKACKATAGGVSLSLSLRRRV